MLRQFYNTWGACYSLQLVPGGDAAGQEEGACRADFQSACEVLHRSTRTSSSGTMSSSGSRRKANAKARAKDSKLSCKSGSSDADAADDAADDAAAADDHHDISTAPPTKQANDAGALQASCLAVCPPPSASRSHSLTRMRMQFLLSELSLRGAPLRLRCMWVAA